MNKYNPSCFNSISACLIILVFLQLLILIQRMAEEDGQEIKIEPDDPEYQLEQHIAFKRKQEALNIQLKKTFQENLSEFRLVMDGSTYAFTKLNLTNKGITAISEVIADYPHLRTLELGSNQISQTMHLQKLRFVVTLNLSRNIIKDGRFLSNAGVFPFLKTLNLSFNKLKALPALNLRNITHLNLNGNEITTVEDFDGHSQLQILELRGNKIASLKGLKNATELRQLYIADNLITTFKALAKLPKLEKIHARKNKISDLTEFPDISSIKYLNLRENQIAKVNLLSGINKSITIINLLANPISDELADNTKKEVWMKFRQYQKVNKSEVTVEEKEEFDKEYKERIAEQERQEREAREQAQRQAAQKQQQS